MPLLHGLDDRQRDRGGERRVDGVAAALQHRDARLHRERLRRRDRVAREDRLPAGGVGEAPVEVIVRFAPCSWLTATARCAQRCGSAVD